MRMTQGLSEAGYRHRGAGPAEAQLLAQEAMRREENYLKKRYNQ